MDSNTWAEVLAGVGTCCLIAVGVYAGLAFSLWHWKRKQQPVVAVVAASEPDVLSDEIRQRLAALNERGTLDEDIAYALGDVSEEMSE